MAKKDKDQSKEQDGGVATEAPPEVETGQRSFSVMELLRKRARYGAIINKFVGKSQKVKPGQDSAETKLIQLEVLVPVTKAIKKRLDPAVAAIIDAATGESGALELPISSLDIHMQVPCVVRFFSRQDFSKDAKPKIECGKGNGDTAVVQLKKVSVKNHEAFLRLLITAAGTEDMWIWGWKVFNKAEVVIETEPLQKDLPFDGDAKDDENEGQ